MPITTGAFPDVSVRRRADAVKLFNSNRRLVETMLPVFMAGIPEDGPSSSEIQQYALMGLWSAALKYDPAKGAAFESYARIRIRAHVLHHRHGDHRGGGVDPRPRPHRHCELLPRLHPRVQTNGLDADVHGIHEGQRPGSDFLVDCVQSYTYTRGHDAHPPPTHHSQFHP